MAVAFRDNLLIDKSTEIDATVSIAGSNETIAKTKRFTPGRSWRWVVQGSLHRFNTTSDEVGSQIDQQVEGVKHFAWVGIRSITIAIARAVTSCRSRGKCSIVRIRHEPRSQVDMLTVEIRRRFHFVQASRVARPVQTAIHAYLGGETSLSRHIFRLYLQVLPIIVRPNLYLSLKSETFTLYSCGRRLLLITSQQCCLLTRLEIKVVRSDPICKIKYRELRTRCNRLYRVIMYNDI